MEKFAVISTPQDNPSGNRTTITLRDETVTLAEFGPKGPGGYPILYWEELTKDDPFFETALKVLANS